MLKIIKTFILIGLVIVIFQSFTFASMRVVSLAPSVTEILYKLGVEEKIVGVTKNSNYPPKVEEKNIVGGFSHPVLEQIVDLNPDVVFTAGIEQKDITLKLKKLDIKTVTIQPKGIEELYESIKKIGKITNSFIVAKEVVQKLKKSVHSVNEKFSHLPLKKRPTIFVLLWHDPLLTAGKNSFVSDVVKHAGGVNVVGKLIHSYSRYNLEVLIQKKPDYILVCGMEPNVNLNYIKKISKLTNSKIIREINPDLILRPGPRIRKGIKEIYKKIYKTNGK